MNQIYKSLSEKCIRGGSWSLTFMYRITSSQTRSKLILVCSIILSTEVFSLECPKSLTLSFDSPKQNESVNGAKQKVAVNTNVKEGLFYHLIQTNSNDKNKITYLQSSGSIESQVISNYVWLGNETKGKNSSFVITIVISTTLVKKEGKVMEWSDKSLKPNEICGKSSVTLNRIN